MNEIRIKLKSFAIGTIVVFSLLFYLVVRTPECSPSVDISNTYQQQVPQTKRIFQPFTVYAITPTYARPVQKAELTRSVSSARIQNLVLFLNFLALKKGEIRIKSKADEFAHFYNFFHFFQFFFF